MKVGAAGGTSTTCDFDVWRTDLLVLLAGVGVLAILVCVENDSACWHALAIQRV